MGLTAEFQEQRRGLDYKGKSMFMKNCLGESKEIVFNH